MMCRLIPGIRSLPEMSAAQRVYQEIQQCEGSAGANIETGVECVYKGCSCSGCCEFFSSSVCTCKCAYKDGYINDSYLAECSPPILECNSNCTCSKSCPNRLTQRLGSLNLSIFKTEGKGLGVRTETSVPGGTFIGEYVGEIVSVAEASARLAATRRAESCYIVQYREHLSDGRVMTTNVDATNKGNVTRFLNHSCDPNVVMVPVRVNSVLPRLCLFSSREVSAGEELCFSYLGKKATSTDTSCVGCKPCLCGSANCIGFLPFESTMENSM